MANFKIFDEPTETELKTECDYESLRKVKMTEMTLNLPNSTGLEKTEYMTKNKK